MRRLLLPGSILVLPAGCDSDQKASPALPPTQQSPPGVVIIPPDSPKLAQIRVEQIEEEKSHIGRM
jgi:hypothetical protein